MKAASLTARFALVVVLSWLPFLVALIVAGDDRVGWLLSALTMSLVIAFGGALTVTRRLERSLERLERATERFAAGDLNYKVYPSRIPQLSGIGRGLNAMGAQLKERVGALVRLSNEQDAVLQAMIEGVITIDLEGRILRVNGAARELLGIRESEGKGRLVEEVIHHLDLQRFIRAATTSDGSTSDTIAVRLPRERYLQVYSSPLKTADREPFATLVVFHDVTKVLRLQNVRRDFVANVSHELKTPITSIKGFVETLLDGASEDPEALRRFLGIIARHAERLNTIFNDLLTLARLEAEGEDARVDMLAVDLDTVLAAAVETCTSGARAKNIQLETPPPGGLRVMINPSLFEQAIVNLLDNAVKYTDNGGIVRLTAEGLDDKVTVSIIDTGCGIEKEHLPRLFERFYRVDHGRSRRMGGTGLGLAIVKHIAQVHGGDVTVASTVGKGSTFSLRVRAGAAR